MAAIDPRTKSSGHRPHMRLSLMPTHADAHAVGLLDKLKTAQMRAYLAVLQNTTC